MHPQTRDPPPTPPLPGNSGQPAESAKVVHYTIIMVCDNKNNIP